MPTSCSPSLPAFALLPDAVRGLVAESFDTLELPFGATIVREGDEADAFFVLALGSARVVKETPHGRGGLAERPPARRHVRRGGPARRRRRERATVRASSAGAGAAPSQQRLRRARAPHPEVRTAFEALARTRALWNFFRHARGLRDSSERGARRARHRASSRSSAPPARWSSARATRRGRCSSSRRAGSVPSTPRTATSTTSRTCARATSSASESLFLGEPRAATRRGDRGLQAPAAPEPSSTRRCSTSTPSSVRGWRSGVLQYDYRRLARVPLDFADEILPGRGVGRRAPSRPRRSAPRACRGRGAPRARRRPTPDRGPGRRFPHVFQIDEMDCGAACLAMICRYYGRAVPISLHPRGRAHDDPRDDAERDHARPPRSSASKRGRSAPRRAGWTSCRCRRSCTGRATTGSSSTASREDMCGSPTRRAGCAATRAQEFLEALDRLRVGDRLRRGARADAGPASEPRAGSSPSCGRT